MIVILKKSFGVEQKQITLSEAIREVLKNSNGWGKNYKEVTQAISLDYPNNNFRMKSLNSDSCANTLSELEKEDRRILTDAKYRKNWKAKQKRILAKATVEDVLYEKYYYLIERAKKLKIDLVYPVSVWGDALEIDNYAFKIG